MVELSNNDFSMTWLSIIKFCNFFHLSFYNLYKLFYILHIIVAVVLVCMGVLQ